jgi:hypothetical protein
MVFIQNNSPLTLERTNVMVSLGGVVIIQQRYSWESAIGRNGLDWTDYISSEKTDRQRNTQTEKRERQTERQTRRQTGKERLRRRDRETTRRN